MSCNFYPFVYLFLTVCNLLCTVLNLTNEGHGCSQKGASWGSLAQAHLEIFELTPDWKIFVSVTVAVNGNHEYAQSSDYAALMKD